MTPLGVLLFHLGGNNVETEIRSVDLPAYVLHLFQNLVFELYDWMNTLHQNGVGIDISPIPQLPDIIFRGSQTEFEVEEILVEK